jgi:hypothetical protein
MNTHFHDFVTVDMRGLKAALVARARSDRVSVSVLVRRAVARDLGVVVVAGPGQPSSTTDSASGATKVKLSIRLTRAEAERLATGARSAGLSRGAYLSGLVAGVPVLTSGGNRADHNAALVTSCAELSTLSRNIHRLTSLLREGNVQPALQYRATLDTLTGDVRSHLMLAARVLAELQPRRRSDDTSAYPRT